MHWPFLAGVSDAIPSRSRYKRLISISTRPKAAKLNKIVEKRELSHFPGDDNANISRFIYIYLWLYL